MGALFFSVVLHELGHALVARGFGVGTAHITLYPFGGIAALRSEPKTPGAEFWIAIAGPLVNLALVGVGAAAWLLTGWMSFAVFAGLNLVMGIFNLIPAFPMDGGRVLRAALSPILGWWRASRVAISLGRAFGVGFIVVGLVWMSFNLMLVGGFLLFATSVEYRKLRLLRWQREKSARSAPYAPKWRVRPR